MTKENLKLVINQETFNTSQEEFEERLVRDLREGKSQDVFLYDENGKFKGVNALAFSIAAIKLLGKLCSKGKGK